MGDFASGMMLGTAMGTGFGWGVPHYGMGFGGFGGWGFGMGFGVPMPSFGGGRGGTVENNVRRYKLKQLYRLIIFL